MDKFEPPSCLRFEGNLSENWQKWRQELELYLTATENDGKSDKIKTSILLTCVGNQGREIYNTCTFQFVEGEEMKFKVVVQVFQDYCSPRKNITFMCHKFFTCKQRNGQSLDEEPELTLLKTIQIGHAAEETKRHVKELQKEVDGKNSVDAVRRKKLARDGKKNSGKQSVGYDKSLLKIFNHFARYCPVKNKSVKNVNCDSSDSDDAPDDTFCVGSVNVGTTERQTNPVISAEERNSTTKTNESNEFTIFTDGSESESEWTVDMHTNGSNVRYKLDTGAQVNVLPKSQYNRLIRKPK
ncbi:Hypothetical predicted protein [Paramuricea clavata]|uniref:Uncharacterized protein n=1 Tax=Paramuricea clavata TaxID=317549 RepID=A0A6S7I523_PARCT|nr:Hypothetical predicted protein [Paramuricea clavata]